VVMRRRGVVCLGFSTGVLVYWSGFGVSRDDMSWNFVFVAIHDEG